MSNEFQQIEKNNRAKIPSPVVSVRGGGELGILATAYKEMGEPTAVKIYTDETRLALEPTNRGERGHSNTYLLNAVSGKNTKSAELKTAKVSKLTGLEPDTKYRIEKDDETGYWVVDPANEYRHKVVDDDS